MALPDFYSDLVVIPKDWEVEWENHDTPATGLTVPVNLSPISFGSMVDDLSDDLETATGWIIEFDPTTNRYSWVPPGSGDVHSFVISPTLATLLGFDSGIIGPGDNIVEAENLPLGLCPMVSFRMSQTIGDDFDSANYDYQRTESIGKNINQSSYDVVLHLSGDQLSHFFTSAHVRGMIYLDGLPGRFSEVRTPRMIDYIDPDGNEIHTVSATFIACDLPAIGNPYIYRSLVYAWTWQYALKIQGIPYLFCENSNITLSGYGCTPSLHVVGSIQQRVDRKEGIAGGSPITVGVMDRTANIGVFNFPSKVATLAGNVAFDDTTINVDDTTSWGSSGVFYLGSEYITYSGKTGTSFTGCVRSSTYGPAYSYSASQPGGQYVYGVCTDTPRAWDGRLCELIAIACDEVGTPLADLSDPDDPYHEVIFIGHVRGIPQWSGGTWRIEIEDVLRRFSRSLGGKVSGETHTPENVLDTLCLISLPDPDVTITTAPIDGSADDSVVVNVWTELDAKGLIPALASEAVVPMRDIWQVLFDAAGDLAVNDVSLATVTVGELYSLSLDSAEILPDGKFSTKIAVSANTWPQTHKHTLSFNFAGTNEKWAGGQTTNGNTFPLQAYLHAANFIETCNIFGPNGHESPIILDAATIDGDLTGLVATNGIMGEQELFGFGGTVEYGDEAVALYPCYRHLFSPPANSTEGGTTVTMVDHAVAPLGQVLLNLMESSSYGDRGVYDTLQTGYGIPEDYIDVPSFLQATEPLTTVTLDGSIAEILGQTIALAGFCLVQWGGKIRLAYLSAVDSGLVPLDLGHEQPTTISSVDAPNAIKVKAAETPYAKSNQSLTFRLREDIALRGEVEQEYVIAAQGTDFLAVAESYAASRIFEAYGSLIATYPCMPWSITRCGTAAYALMSGDMLYRQITGAHGLVDSPVRLLEVKRNLRTQECEVTLHIRTHSLATILSPAARVDGIAGDVITVEAGDLAIWGDETIVTQVVLYIPGEETEYEILDVLTISGNDITTVTTPTVTGTIVAPVNQVSTALFSGNVDVDTWI